jgi:hypothetical protein
MPHLPEKCLYLDTQELKAASFASIYSANFILPEGEKLITGLTCSGRSLFQEKLWTNP